MKRGDMQCEVDQRPALHILALQDFNYKPQLRKEVSGLNQASSFASCLGLGILISEMRFFRGSRK